MTNVSDNCEFAIAGSCKHGLHTREGRSTDFPCSSCRTECLSELLGTYLLVFIGPASVVLSTLFLGFQTLGALAFVALSFGGTVAILIFLLGKYSGAYINPALTAAAETAGLLKKGLLLPFLLFQMLGGLLAGLSLRFVFGPIDQVRVWVQLSWQLGSAQSRGSC